MVEPQKSSFGIGVKAPITMMNSATIANALAISEAIHTKADCRSVFCGITNLLTFLSVEVKERSRLPEARHLRGDEEVSRESEIKL